MMGYTETIVLFLIIVSAIVFLVWRYLFRNLSDKNKKQQCDGCSDINCSTRFSQQEQDKKDKSKLLAIIFFITLFAPHQANAADTLEVFDKAAFDFEFYVATAGLGAGERQLTSDLVFGYGITNYLSVFIGWTSQSDDQFEKDSHEVSGGIALQALNTTHFDIDLFIESRMNVKGEEPLIRPGFELNFDIEQDLSLAGFYLRAALPLYNRTLNAVDHPTKTHTLAGRHLEVVFGAYYTLFKDHQILVEHDVEFRPQANNDERTFGIGGIAIGYNYVINNTVELITQSYIDIPQENEDLCFGFSIGAILTI